MMTPLLDLNTIDLHGTHLIEASAGTGKTWSIASLYVRLLIEPGVHHEPLDPANILVVTFTNDATRELRHRISDRILQTIHAFESGTDEPFLQRLIATNQNRADCIRRLRWAQSQMDLAPISTIHSFAINTLQTNAFESATTFNLSMSEQEDSRLLDLLTQVWRDQFYPLNHRQYGWITSVFSSPQKLFAALKKAVMLTSAHPHYTLQPKGMINLAQALSDCLEAEDRVWGEYHEGAELQHWLSQVKVKKDYRPILDECHEAIIIGVRVPAYTFIEVLNVFDQHRLKSTKVDTPQTPFFDAVVHLRDLQKGLHWTVLKTALDAVIELQNRTKNEGVFSFDAILLQLYTALKDDQSGRVLIDRVRKHMPVALIDEFQDTNQIQWGIFEAVWGRNATKQSDAVKNSALYLIGDPKQAIYRFRGADIDVYFQAKASVQSHWRLGTNYRSNSVMVDAVNQLFSFHHNTFVKGIDYQPVDAHAGADDTQLLIDQAVVTGLHVGLLETSTPLKGVTHTNTLLIEQTTQQIVQLLALGAQERARFVDHSNSTSDTHSRGVRASDIAVLVYSKVQAYALIQALRKHGIACVFSSEKISVFKSSVAFDYGLFLKLLHAPTSVSLVRQFFGSMLLGMQRDELKQLATDQGLDACIAQAAEWRKTFEQYGVLAATRQFLFSQDVPAKLMRYDYGQRWLVDVLHLAELTQTYCKFESQIGATVRWFEQQRLSAHEPQTNRQRLESDMQAVQIATIHTSKGLEYPIVFAPFLTLAREDVDDVDSTLTADADADEIQNFEVETDLGNENESEVKALFSQYTTPTKKINTLAIPQQFAHQAFDAPTNDLSESAVIDFVPSAEQLKAELTQEFAQKIRLAYVALTRAVHASFTFVADHKIGRAADAPNQFHSSALGWCLNADSTQAWAKSAKQCSAVNLYSSSSVGWPCIDTSEADAGVIDFKQPIGLHHTLTQTDYRSEPILLNIQRSLDDYWRHMSFTGLVRYLSPASFRHSDSDSSLNQTDVSHKAALFIDFPRGARVGIELHRLIESFNFSAIDDATYVQKRVNETINSLRIESYWSEALVQMLQSLALQTLNPLSDAHEYFSLSQIPADKRLNELQFYLNAVPDLKQFESTQRAWLGRMSKLNVIAVETNDRLDAPTLKGMLNGSIDGLIQHGDQFYLVDYKSNDLGHEIDAYTHDHLLKHVFSSRYDLQMAIYSVAVTRYLKSRVANFDLSKHFGGFVFVYLRGLPDPSSSALSQQSTQTGICHLIPDAQWWTQMYETFGLDATDD